MADAAEAQPADAPEETRTSFSKKPPIVLADNGHGTKVKLWTNNGTKGEFHSVSIERSYKEKDGDDWKTQKVSLNAEDLLAVAHALEKGHAQIVEKRVASQGHARG